MSLNPDGSFDYTPDPGFYEGDSFTYKANDGQVDSAQATVSITVNRGNNAAVTVDDSYTTNEDTELVVARVDGVLDNDTDGDDERSALANAGKWPVQPPLDRVGDSPAMDAGEEDGRPEASDRVPSEEGFLTRSACAASTLCRCRPNAVIVE